MAKKQSKPGPPKAPKKLDQPSKEYRLIERAQEKMPVEISQKERDAAAIRLAELIEEKEELTEGKREAMREWRVKLNAKQEEIDDCAAGVLRGAMPTQFTVETRAVYKARTIERVRIQDNVVIESRPMTPDEELQYLQPALPSTDDQTSGDVTTTLKFPASALTVDKPTTDEDDDSEELDEDRREALGGLPAGWRKAWVEGRWLIDGQPMPLCGADLWEIYLRIPLTGGTLADVSLACLSLQHLSLDHVARALQVMKRGGVVKLLEDGVWMVAAEAPPEPTEPGRSDPLPEAAVSPKPKRRGAKTKAEALLNAALDQSEAHEAVH